MLDSTGTYQDHSCSSGQFYNPLTQGCSDCLYCVVQECQEECDTIIQSKKRTDSFKNVRVQSYKFPSGRANPWKSAFIGIVCGLGAMMTVGTMYMCVKRRQYQQPGNHGNGSWSLNMPSGGVRVPYYRW